MSSPVQAGAFMCFVCAFGLGLAWLGLWMAMEGHVRPTPIEMAELASRHRTIFVTMGVAWVVLHTMAIWIVVSIFLVHSDVQRPSLWIFTGFISLAVFCWALFGALSIPLGVSTGPQYGEAMDRAQLSPSQLILWTARCAPTTDVLSTSGLTRDEVLAACNSASGEPFLRMYEPEFGQLTDQQRLHLNEAWAAAQDSWLLRKLSDTLFFAGNGLAVVSLFFFAKLALTSRVIRTFSVTWATTVAVLYVIGFAAFWSRWAVGANFAAISGHIGLLIFIGTDIWAERGEFAFSQVRPDRRPVRLLRREVRIEKEELAWTYELSDLWYRNRQITNAYARLAYQIGIVTHKADPGLPDGNFPEQAPITDGNWYHFGVWASNSAGERIWRADISSGSDTSLERTFREVLNFADGKRRLAETLAEGNRLVFGHVAVPGYLFIKRFQNVDSPDEAAWDAFVRDVAEWDDSWRPTGEGIVTLLSAFRAYFEARFATPDNRSRLLLLGNLRLVEYEQRQLDPVIKAATGSGVRLAVVFIFPSPAIRAAAWTAALATYPVRRAWPFPSLAGRRSLKDVGTAWEERSLVAIARLLMKVLSVFSPGIQEVSARQIALTIGSSEDRNRIIVGRPLPMIEGEESTWVEPTSPEQLVEFWKRVVGDLDRPVKVENYTELSDRLQFIAVLFQRWQKSPLLREEPFSFAQRKQEGLILTSIIEPDFDSGLFDRAKGGTYAVFGGGTA